MASSSSVDGKIMKQAYFLMIILSYISISLGSFSVLAQGSFAPSINAQQSSKQAMRVKSPKQAAQLAQRHLGGKVLKVKSQKSGYKVKLIKKNGHIVSIFINAKSGKISGR